MISSRLIKSNNTAAGCVDIVDAYDPFGDLSGLALYQLNGNANDVSGVNNGFSVTGVTWGSPGVFGTSASFPGGTSAKIGFPDIINSHSTTISAWVKGSGYWCTPQKEIYAPLGTSDLYWGASGTSTSLTGVEDGNWHHIAVCATSARTVDYYVDGVQVAHNVSATDFPQNYNYSDNWIGHFYHPNTPQSFNGLIDQFRIFNRGLTPLEVEALYIEESCLCGGTVDTLDILDDSSCIALYPLDGNANDLSGNYSGTPTNVSYGVGEFDLAGVFNGSSSKIITSSSQLPIPASGAFTVSFWAKVNSSLTLYNTCMISFGDFWIKSEYQTGRFGLGDLNPGYETTSSMGYAWNHCVLTVDASNNIKLYLNGANEFTGNKSISRTNGGNFAIGVARLSSPVYYFNGELDQVRIFNKALNAGEVTTLYNETACTPAACASGTTNTLDILGDGSCIAAYTLDGTPADLSGNYNGVQTNVTYPQGYFDLAGSFNGSSSYIELATNSLNFLTTYSMSAWINSSNSITGSIAANWGWPGSGAELGWLIRKMNDNKIRVTNSNGTIQNYNSTSTIPLNTWTNVVVTNTQSQIKIYINGSLDSTHSSSGFTVNAGYPMNPLIGAYKYQSTYDLKFTGQIDQVRIFNKALTAGEVTTLYNETPCN